ncbi:hypothetical protein SUGI_1204090 [Cryptomeria japonica]|uniref:17.3 kDa class I heat shock protein n=1 Tax=Cryptomeria japonica TaxID=3369 RepID=UPI002414A53F|nr:17.3 kDa class I heat shock protein [Cryptomeria japonica]GLJ56087.1 hypothetical protein SUGI_1204090 [Cryptomeria japonica]
MALQFFNRAYDPLFQQLESLALSEPSQIMSKDPAQISVDWRETPHAHMFQADLPGVKKEDVKLEIQNGVMEIRGKQAEEGEEDQGVTWHAMERPVHLSKGLRVRRIALPEDANVEEVKASVSQGVLTVNIPKKPVRKPHVKKVEIEDANKEGIGHKIVKSLKGIVAPAKAK